MGRLRNAASCMNIWTKIYFQLKLYPFQIIKLNLSADFQVVPNYKISSCPTDYGALILIGGISLQPLGEICGATTCAPA